MILLDTHAWIPWVAEDYHFLSKAAIKAIKKAESLGVSAISCWEVAMLSSKKRLTLQLDVQDWVEIALKRPGIQLMNLDPEILVLSTRLPGEFHPDPADQMIAATALKYGIPLVTKDKYIHQWGHIETIW